MPTCFARSIVSAAAAACCVAVAAAVLSGQAASQPALFDYKPSPAARYERRATTPLDVGELRELSFASPRGGTVTAYLLMPRGNGPFPLVVYGHWGSGTKSSFLPEAMLLARAGVASFLADAPFARALDSYKEANGPDARDVYIQTVVDTRYALDFLQRKPALDASRIAYVGLSFGAQVGSILAGVDPRIRACVIMGGLPSLARALATGEQPPLVKLRERMTDKESFRRFLDELAAVDSERYVRGRHGPILFQFGRYDAAIPQASAKELGEAATPPKEVRWYAVGHEFNDVESLNDRVEWLGRQLRFTPPCVRVESACGGR